MVKTPQTYTINGYPKSHPLRLGPPAPAVGTAQGQEALTTLAQDPAPGKRACRTRRKDNPGKTREEHGEDMQNIWEIYWKYGKIWQNHGKYMGRLGKYAEYVWKGSGIYGQTHGKAMEIV